MIMMTMIKMMTMTMTNMMVMMMMMTMTKMMMMMTKLAMMLKRRATFVRPRDIASCIIGSTSSSEIMYKLNVKCWNLSSLYKLENLNTVKSYCDVHEISSKQTG